ncbi:hypothetical protein XCCB100_2349 [Xanthomonas campestris pv. campestris]|uniref:Uncharacterized protein n=1 Tax=Xanthomonas campestris pv. campestris (strain B100) TaxID=509169 RepID=B0RTC0_XANCB|nr:hypothetical protein XCCB100_2349 [Xanthomonas campestris pv. campestris]
MPIVTAESPDSARASFANAAASMAGTNTLILIYVRPSICGLLLYRYIIT